MTPAAGWLAAGLVLCGAELVAPGIYLLWIGLAALLVGAALQAVALSFAGQASLFAVVALASVLAGRTWQGRRSAGTDPNAPGSDLVGQRCRALAFDGAEGRVRFRDGEWPARMASPADASAAPGDGLVIVGLDGTRLLVRRAPRNEG